MRTQIQQQKIINSMLIVLGTIMATATLACVGSAVAGAGAAAGGSGGGTVIEMAAKTAGDQVAEELLGRAAAASVVPIWQVPAGASETTKKAAANYLDGLLGKYRPKPFRRPRFKFPPASSSDNPQQPSTPSQDATSKNSPIGSGNVVPIGGESGGFPPLPGEYQPSQDFPKLKKLAEDMVLISPDSPGHGDSSFDDQVGAMANWLDTMAQQLGGTITLFDYLGVDKTVDLNDDSARLGVAHQLIESSNIDEIMALFEWLAWAPLAEVRDMLPPNIQLDGSVPADETDIQSK